MLECTKCKLEKEECEFRVRKDLTRGFQSWCKECQRVDSRKRYRPKPPKLKKLVDEQQVKLEAKKRMLMYRYRLDYNTYLKMYDEQGGCCKICKDPKKLGGFTGLQVDHDHQSGEVRGLLCRNCNTAIGKFKENIEFIKAAVDYLGLR